MAYQSYEDLDVWQKSVDISVAVYSLLRNCRDYGFKDQICRSSVSIASNLAEGMERRLKKETTQFLHIAKGSCAELRTQLLIGTRVGYVNETAYTKIKEDAESISRMLHGLIKTLNSEI